MRLGDAIKEVQVEHNAATEKNDLGAVADVATKYEVLLNDAPDDLRILFGLGTAKMQLGYNGAAITFLRAALQVKELPEIWNNLGSALKAENHGEEARRCWQEALKFRDDADYYNNMVTLYVNEGNPGPGIEWAEKGLKVNPQHARLRWNYSLCLLESGRWEDGFKEYDWGLLSLDRPNRRYDNEDSIPWWHGEKGQHVVVYGEQGMGDEIMFASCIPDLVADCERVIFDCHPRMVDLWERSYPGLTCIGTRKDVNIEWPKRNRIDAKLALGSLFGIYRKNGKFPRKPYLKADPKLVEHYKEKMAEFPGPHIGIAWQAGVKKTRVDLRSLKLSWFRPLMDHGGTFFSLQYTEGAKEKCERFYNDTGIRVHHWEHAVETGGAQRWMGYNYDHTVAIIEALDLCILPNTTAVHTCGALGKECWTITPEAPAWRYQLTGDHMPMYGDWVKQYRGKDALERIAKDYKERF